MQLLVTNIKSASLITAFLLLTLPGLGQDRMYVTAKSGLIVRESPSLESKKLYTLKHNTMVLISEKTGIKITITDEDQEIHGEWLKVLSLDHDDTQGYVFSGFLTSEIPEIWYSQKNAYYKSYSYDNLQEGTFEPKSTSAKYLKKDLPVIPANMETLNSKEYPDFLNPMNRKIVLFENHNLKNLKPSGILNSLTQVRIDSTFYKFRYKDLTNNVWNRININGKYYYTDVDIHDFSISKDLVNLNQKVTIIGQYTGYDGAYHLGYPEHFFMVFTDKHNDVIYKTEILDFHLNSEFAMEEDILTVEWNERNKSYKITLTGYKDEVRIDWNGKVSRTMQK
ncbi:MAG: SH3 domain-containing protein [Balneola sp.]|nr:SH3 domain-containing protein [Balneola sp.]MBO6798985.1 SH3 domain-containing protein [Balneola sp.]MBO6870099.1 SH3 domain-containing protein [Balneola sp.]